MEDYSPANSGCNGLVIIAAVVVVAVACLWFGSYLLTERITSNQAAAAAAQAQIQREQTQQTRIVEDAHTERWQSFLVAMRGVQADVTAAWPMVLCVVVLWTGMLFMMWRDRK